MRNRSVLIGLALFGGRVRHRRLDPLGQLIGGRRPLVAHHPLGGGEG